jgi:polar amino acid transport system permease protein
LTYQFHWEVLLEYRGLLLEGMLATVKLAIIGMVVSTVLGIAIGLARVFLPPPLSWLFVVYTEVFRNIPPIVQFFLWFFAVSLDLEMAAVVGLSIFHSAYIAELVRSGINAVPRTQWDASRAAGMTAVQSATRVILPQALIRIVPLFSNQFVGILKDTSIAMTIGYTELTFQTQEIESLTFRGFEAATAVTVLYVVLAVVVVLLMHGVERLVRLDIKRG